jgi:hypothetical protein
MVSVCSVCLPPILQDFKVSAQTLALNQASFASGFTEWAKTQPLETLNAARATADDVAATAELLSSPAAVKLGFTLCHFLYVMHVVGSPAFPGHLRSHLVTRGALVTQILARGRRRTKGKKKEDVPGG